MDSIGFRVSWLLFLLVVIIFLYSKVSRKSGSYLNIFTPVLALDYVVNYFFEIWYSVRNATNTSIESFLTVSLMNFLAVASLLVGFLLVKKTVRIEIFFEATRRLRSYKLEALFFFVAGLFAMLPLIREYGVSLIFSARDVYTMTRTGWGVSTFLAPFFLYISFVFLLFSCKEDVSIFKIIIFTLIYSFLLFMLGSKSKLLSLLFIVYFWRLLHKKFNIKSYLFVVILLCFPLVGGVFVDSFKTTDRSDSLVSVLDNTSYYSDYNRNAIMVLDSREPHTYGRIFLEDYFVSKIPRAIYPDKPKNFGQFGLAEKYYPDWFDSDSGSPSFGRASLFLDFGFLAFPLIFLAGTLGGACVAALWNSSGAQKNPYAFIVMSSLLGVGYLAVGVGSFFMELIMFVMCLYVMRFLKIPKLKLYSVRKF